MSSVSALAYIARYLSSIARSRPTSLRVSFARR